VSFTPWEVAGAAAVAVVVALAVAAVWNSHRKDRR
jgi:hypothetical protein